MSVTPQGFPAVNPSILHDAAQWCVIAKPAGLHTVAQQGGSEASLEAWLRAELPLCAELPECGLVHRLDFETSGCVLVAKNAAAHAHLREAFSGRGGNVEKIYLARVESSGKVSKDRLANEGSFTLSFTNRHKGSAKVSVSERGGAENIGRCRWRARAGSTVHSPPSTLIEVELLGPGRRHQIRAGLAFLGLPLVGDTLYGAQPFGATDGANGGICLHAWRVEVDGITVESPAPNWA